MQWPEGAKDSRLGAPQLSIGPTGRVEPNADAAAVADGRFEAICAELGILLARRVEPVSARVLPFGREQLAMVQVLDGTEDSPTIFAAAAHGPSRGVAIAEAAIDAMTGGNNVLAAALPGAVAEGKVRTAVVFPESDAPVRWGLSDDEGRLAALYAVVPHLGLFTATAGADTYRVLRLPGVGVSLVSEGPSAAAWVEGWFAALIHATQFALRTAPQTTGVVAPSRSPLATDRLSETDSVLSELEAECRRILTAAQDQAAEILGAARTAAVREDEERRADSARLEALRAELRAAAATHDEDRPAPRPDDRLDDRLDGRDRGSHVDRAREAWERTELQGLAVERERIALLTDAERERASTLAEARREAEALRREAERDRATILGEAKREADALLRDAERARTAMFDATRRELDELRDAARRSSFRPVRGDGRELRDRFVGEARRAADDVLLEARRAAKKIVREAEKKARRRAERTGRPRDDAAPSAVVEPAESPVTESRVAESRVAESRTAELALLTAAAESVTAMATLLGSVAVAGRGSATDERTHEPLSDLPRLFFGA